MIGRSQTILAIAIACGAAAAAQQPARDNVRAAPGTGSISGNVFVNGEGRQPARRVRVTLTNVARTSPGQTTTTDDSGAFVFRGLPAGRFELQAFKNAYLRASYGASRPDRAGTHVVVNNGEAITNLTMTIARGGVITGVVRDLRGAPLPGVNVRVLKLGYNAVTGERTLGASSAGSVALTDDRGEYRAFGLPPGGYLALVTPIKLPLSTSNLGTWLGKLLGCDNLTPSQPYNFAGTTPSGIDLNQQGLTGSWYEPATSGQGFEVEVFPDFTGPGVGLTQVSWFTFDALAGGADRQRWYTLSGNVQNGQPTASLTIYRNVGGNFNAPPTTNGVAVGTATLRFDSCSGGELAYNFTDGSGLNGTIPLTRLTQNATCSTTGARPTNADFALSGNWYQPATSGQGFTVEVNPGSATLFFAWYTYAPGGAAAGAAGQRWYTGQGSFAPGMRSVPVTLYETTGGVFDSTATAPHSVPVGTATLAFQSCSSATLNFNFTGGSSAGASGAIALSRIGPVPSGCT